MTYIVHRYPEITFQAKMDFTCPACSNACNCDLCCRKKDIPYQKTDYRKWEDVQPKPIPSNSGKLANGPTRTPLKSPSAKRHRAPPYIGFSGHSPAPTGSYFGAVYGLSGELLGKAWRGEGHKNHVVVSRPTAKRRGRQRVFIGKIQDWWGPGSGARATLKSQTDNRSQFEGGDGNATYSGSVRFYIGDKSLLSRSYRQFHSFPDPQLDGPMLSASQEMDGNGTMWELSQFTQESSWNSILIPPPNAFDDQLLPVLNETELKTAIFMGLSAL